MKISNKELKQIIKEELDNVMLEMRGMMPPMQDYSRMEMGMGPDHPDYDHVGGIIMEVFRHFVHLAPMVKQGYGRMFENDIYAFAAERSPEHADYITERVMSLLMEM
jgi:hypothetical protein